MTDQLPVQRVEIRFVGTPPTQQVQRASGVSDVEVDGPMLRCLVSGSFQPILEALLGHEVLTLTSTAEKGEQPGRAREASSRNFEGGKPW